LQTASRVLFQLFIMVTILLERLNTVNSLATYIAGTGQNVTKLRLFLCYRGVSVLPWNALLSQIFEDRKLARRVPGADDRRRGEENYRLSIIDEITDHGGRF